MPTQFIIKQLRESMLNWKEIPFMRILLPFMTGIISVVYFDTVHWMLYGFTILLATFLLSFKYFIKNKYSHRWIFGIASNLLIALFGYLWCYHHNETRWQNHFQKQVQEENFIIGTVVNSPSDGGYINTHLKVQQIGQHTDCLLYTSPSPRDATLSRMPSSA